MLSSDLSRTAPLQPAAENTVPAAVRHQFRGFNRGPGEDSLGQLPRPRPARRPRRLLDKLGRVLEGAEGGAERPAARLFRATGLAITPHPSKRRLELPSVTCGVTSSRKFRSFPGK